MLANLSIRTKLVSAFVAVAILCAAVGGFGYTGLSSLSGGMKTIYDDRVVCLAQIKRMADVYGRIIPDVAARADRKEISTAAALKEIAAAKAVLEKDWKDYTGTYLTPEEKTMVDAVGAKRPAADAEIERLERALSSGDSKTVAAIATGGLYAVVAPIDATFEQLTALQVRVAGEEVAKGAATVRGRVLWLLGLTIAAVIAAVVLGLGLTSLIVTPLNAVRDAARRIALGDVDQHVEHKSGDELGALADATRDMITYNKDVAAAVQRLGQGDLAEGIDARSPQDLVARNLNEVRARIGALTTAVASLAKSAADGQLDVRGDEKAFAGAYQTLIREVNGLVDAAARPLAEVNGALKRLAERDLTTRMNGSYKGEFAMMQNSFNAATEALADALGEVKAASEQVAAASGEIQQASQQLATGASQQASALEEVSASLQESVSGAKRSAANSAEATALSRDAQKAVRGGTTGMERLSSAMDRIKESTDQTARILRTIDEIAFQTNLLALNAAVEAARAGDAGRGFAVVADEVRNLAIRSADAAKQTAALIEQSLTSVNEGVELNQSVVKAFHEIDTQVTRVGSVIAEISQAAEGQAQGAVQIGVGVEETSKVTQLNAASSEEAAAAAEELSAQARTLEGLVSQFRLDARSTVVRAPRVGTIGAGPEWEESVVTREPALAGVGAGDDSFGF